ncbi:sugar MFS transporter [Aliiglaciecola lipolytica]|uniref:Glucose/galactose transporter n=1 Tax=Aliiglaciecola lipolytica E3 TaxID=1127673 RepID=K6X7J9_9ALTE|nr:sugar MFS transporter [Aliiglaciecola lipolytica]GAC16599.1 glucose/galactose transporter [Aliiglaciecola lipolytica E3]
MQSSTTSMPTTASTSSIVPMVIIGTLFFIFGFITWLNGALIPFLQIVCDLTETQALLIAFSFYIAYVVMALPMAWVLEKTGFKHAMVLGLVLIAAGCLLFIPAAQSQMFALFLVAQFVVGSGLTILQTASNPYVVKVGPHKTAAVRISIMGLLNKGAGVLAPMIFTAMVLGDFEGVNAQSIALLSEDARVEQINALADGLIMPYLWMAVALIVLAVLLKFSALPELDLSEDRDSDDVADTSGLASQVKSSITQFPQLILGVITLFFYVGVEVIAGDTIGLFGSKLAVENATSLTSYTMVFMVIGYVMGLLFIPRVISQQQALFGSAVLGVVFSILIVLSDPLNTSISAVLWGWMGIPLLPDTITYIALLGFANALVWPAVWPLALAGLGVFTARGSALLIMGIAGGAVLPLVYGLISDAFDGQSAYWMMIPCYLFILFYAIKGHKMRNW